MRNKEAKDDSKKDPELKKSKKKSDKSKSPRKKSVGGECVCCKTNGHASFGTNMVFRAIFPNNFLFFLKCCAFAGDVDVTGGVSKIEPLQSGLALPSVPSEAYESDHSPRPSPDMFSSQAVGPPSVPRNLPAHPLNTAHPNRRRSISPQASCLSFPHFRHSLPVCRPMTAPGLREFLILAIIHPRVPG